MLQKNFKLEVKSVEDDGTFTGYASVTGNLDSDNEIIDKGAFKRTLDHNKGVVPILWNHDREKPVGWNLAAQEDGFGLSVKGRLMTDTELGRYAQSFLKSGLAAGAKPGLSIGFVVPKDGSYYKEGVRHFKEVALKEYSIATFQSNLEATVTTAKSDAKTKRVAGEDLTSSCFAYVGDENDTSTWKLPIKFSTPEKTASHIRNALARFSQTQGIPESEKAAVLAKIKRAAKANGIDTGDKSQKDFQDALEDNSLSDDRQAIERALQTAVCDAMYDPDMSDDDKRSEIGDSYSQYADAMSDWYSRFIDSQSSDDDDDSDEDSDMKNEKSGRSLSAYSLQKISMAQDAMNQGLAAINKGIGHLEDLSKRGYTHNDVNLPNPVGGKAEEVDNSESAAKVHVLTEEDTAKAVRSVADIFKAA
jgi:HK97 family phage prohead protease